MRPTPEALQSGSMGAPDVRRSRRGRRKSRRAAALFLALLAAGSLAAVDVTVVDEDGTPVPGFRWLLQEDTTYHVTPGVTDADTLSVNFHSSHAPVVASGHEATGTAGIVLPDTAKHYFVSVLPDGGHSLGGAAIAPGQTAVKVWVHTHPIPTAQISVFVFHDNNPINNAADLPQEQGLAGFKIILEDAGGKYGVSAGVQMTDAFGYPLGTVYDENGGVAQLGDGVVATDANGRAQIRNLAPGKYGITIVPPAVDDPEFQWQQTTTIEGKKTNDAWVKANEPPFWVEFGPPGFHIAVGFVKKFRDPDLTGPGSISGEVVLLHNSRPPDFTFYHGFEPFEAAWVALNEVLAGGVFGRGLYAAPTDGGAFAIPDLPAGTPANPRVYQLVVWDRNLDVIIASRNVDVPDAAGNMDVDLGQVPVFHWFGRYEAVVFNDKDQDGFRDADEEGILEQACNLRFRDGSLYQSMPTDLFGEIPFEEVFPFFNWLVAEVDFARYKATGATMVVDAGGPVLPMDPDNPWGYPSFDRLTPQPQFAVDPLTGAVVRDPVTGLPSTPAINPNTGNNLSRTETGPVLTEAFQVFLGQTVHIDWGKAPYADGESGGIAGIVYYGVTRAENDPALAVAEPWEPGIPRVQVNLYEDLDGDRLIDDRDGVGNQVPGAPYHDPENPLLTMPDIDSYPLSYDADSGTWSPGPEDHDWNGNGQFDRGDAIEVVWTDSWDDSKPTGCQGNVEAFTYTDGSGNTVAADCFDGLRNFNQTRPGIFDGGYMFPGEILQLGESYVVEVVPPPGYEVVQEEDKNVDFGDEFCPADQPGFDCPTPFPDGLADMPDPGLAVLGILDRLGLNPVGLVPAAAAVPPDGGPMDLRPPILVGRPHTVPPYLTLFPDQMIEAPFAGETRPGAERKLVTMVPQLNGVADFFLFTEVPVAGQLVGFVLNDLANEFDPKAPTFGEKQSPSFLPVSLRDWTGREIARSYTDRWGAYNFLVPSSYTANRPAPSGFSPNMLTVSINDPGPVPNPAYVPGGTEPEFILDPHFNTKYSQFPYTFQYMPGSTTYLDTPVVPVGAFASPGQLPADCELVDGTPVIASASCPASGGGPYADVSGGPQAITITSLGTVLVPNPRYDPGCAAGDPGCISGAPELISRDFGFGSTPGTVTLGGVPLAVALWSSEAIEATVPAAGIATGQLMVIRGDNGRVSEMGVTVTVGPIAGNVLRVNPGGGPYTTIQEAVDAAAPGDLVLVPPGGYEELVIVTKPLQLQGWGAPSTKINAVQAPAEKILNWREQMDAIFDSGLIDLLPGQEAIFRDFLTFEPILAAVEGAGVSLFASNTFESLKFGPDRPARIDGLSIVGASTGGGIFVNGYVSHLEIANNRIVTNQGFASGGIRIGHPDLLAPTGGAEDAHNDHVRIHHNLIAANGGLGFAGGGISLYDGSDYYEVADNTICGNFSEGSGAGIGHLGKSEGGRILRNKILYNQSFNQGLNRNGGGIFIGGRPAPVAALGPGAPAAPVARDELTTGSGSVEITGNLVQGNQAGAGNGGGLSLDLINGQDVFDHPDDPSLWHTIDVRRNVIVNNQAGFAAGGVSLQDAASVILKNNTITNNQSTATVGDTFTVGPLTSEPEPAGVVSHQHSTKLEQFIVDSVPASVPARYRSRFSNPLLPANIIWHNQSLHFEATVVDPAPPAELDFGLVDDGYWDLAVKGAVPGARLNPVSCLLTDTFGYDASNISGDPGFAYEYVNVDRGQTIQQVEFTTIPETAIAFDEGGNFIDVRYGPLTRTDETGALFDYHLTAGSIAIDAGVTYGFAPDLDGEMRSGTIMDIGADEHYAPSGNRLAPVAGDDAYEMPVTDGQLVVPAPGVLANDFDPDGDVVYMRFLTNPQNGTLTRDKFGRIVYTPNAGFLGTDSFTYRCVDRDPALADPEEKFSIGRVAITVIEPDPSLNSPPNPVLVDPDLLAGGGQGIQVLPNGTGTVRVNPQDPNPQDTHDFSIMTANPENPADPAGPLNGVASVTATGGVSYTPDSGFNGTDTFYVLVRENNTPDLFEGWVRVDVLVALTIPPSQDLLVQMPLDTDGVDTDGDGDPANDHKYILLGAGDGLSTMADGRPMYGFGFNDLSALISGPGEVATPLHPDPDNPERTDPAADPYGIYTVPLRAIMDLNVGMLGAEFPASTVRVAEGQKFYLNLMNIGMAMRPDLFDPHTVHWHGFPNAATVFDGVPDSSISINMGSNLTYFYYVAEPGTYMYHCHVEATEHMQMGMLGNLYVAPIQDNRSRVLNPAGDPAATEVFGGFTKFAYNDGDGSTGYHVDYPIQLGAFDPDFHDASAFVQPLPFAAMVDRYPMINGRGYPDTLLPADIGDTNHDFASQRESSLITATQGQRVLLRISNLNVTRFHTLRCSLPMLVVGQDAKHLRNSRTVIAAIEVEEGKDGKVTFDDPRTDRARDAYKGLTLRFTSGALAGLARAITTSRKDKLTVEPDFPVRPQRGDTFDIVAERNLYYTTYSLELGGGISYDVIIDTAGVPPGTYLLYTTNLHLLHNNDELDDGGLGGMVTEIRITAP